MGNVNGWRGWAIGHGDAVSPPLSRPYLANHLSVVMGPVQLSELSRELKPAPARGLDRETVRADQALVGKARMERRTWPGPMRAWVPTDHQGHCSESGGGVPLLSGKMSGFGRAGCVHIVQEGKPRQEATSGSQWGWGGPRPSRAVPGP